MACPVNKSNSRRVFSSVKPMLLRSILTRSQLQPRGPKSGERRLREQ